MGSRLPPLAALRAFEAAARRTSFKAAAEELAVTPTAISHQIRQLEAYLGLRVLDRTPRSVKLTAPGSLLYTATASGFAKIERAVDQLRANASPVAITLSSTAAFLNHWLVPRLDALRHAVPGVDLRLHVSNAAERLRPGGIDVAIRYGRGPFTDTISAQLCADAFVPVCSPSLGLKRLEDLQRAKLIHVDGRHQPQADPSWRRWCELAGVIAVDSGAGVRFPDSMLAVQAAIAGQGVVIVSRILVTDALAAGLLVAPFQVTIPGEAYHFVFAPELNKRPEIGRLREWFQFATHEHES